MLLALIIVATLEGSPGAQAAPKSGPAQKNAPVQTQTTKDAASDDLAKARAGDAEAQFRVARARESESSDGLAEAVMWYYSAAAQKHAGAQKRLRELMAPLMPPPPAPAVIQEPAAAKAAPKNDGWTSPIVAAFAITSLALLASMASIFVSWSRTRHALREAGLL